MIRQLVDLLILIFLLVLDWELLDMTHLFIVAIRLSQIVIVSATDT